MYFLRSRIRRISGLLLSLLEDQNETDSEVISWNEFYYAGSGTDCTLSGTTETGAEIPSKNGARTYFSCCWQFYVLFLGAEFFDWLVIDTIWVALSDWWIIPGTEDLNDTWHSVHVKKWKMLQLIPFSIPISAIVGGLYWGIRVLSL